MTLGEVQQECVDIINRRLAAGLPRRGAVLTMKRPWTQSSGRMMLWGTAKKRGPLGVIVDSTDASAVIVQADANVVLKWIHDHIPVEQHVFPDEEERAA